MSVDPNKIIPHEVDHSYDGIQEIKDYIPTSQDTAAEVRDKMRKFTSYIYKYLEQLNAPPHDGI